MATGGELRGTLSGPYAAEVATASVRCTEAGCKMTRKGFGLSPPSMSWCSSSRQYPAPAAVRALGSFAERDRAPTGGEETACQELLLNQSPGQRLFPTVF